MQKFSGIIFQSYLIKAIILAFLYIITGKLGLMLSVPPGYATIIWPASGIAVGMLIVFGWRLFPGIFIGSFLLNCYIAGVTFPPESFLSAKIISAFAIAVGSTLQALCGRWLIARVLGIPLHLHHMKDVLILFALCGPLACLIGAGIGTASLYFSNIIVSEQILRNWLTWWSGDVIGVIVFLPLVLIAPLKQQTILWRGKYIGVMPVFTLLILMVPLGATFYGWKIVTENQFHQGMAEFESLVMESEKALLHRMDSYNHSLLGGVGFIKGSSYVSREEWRSYIETIDLMNNFPGINGIGFIEEVQKKDVAGFEKKQREEGAAEFKIHPEANYQPLFIINYIEPESKNRQAIGLNIGFEENRRDAAIAARDSGKPAITKMVKLVQDTEKTPGFLLLHPFYKQDMPYNTIEERRKSFRGWVYAPMIAKNFLHNLTRSQNKYFNIRIYDGNEIKPESLVYSSNTSLNPSSPVYRTSKEVEIMQQKWLIIWESTLAYEQMETSETGLYVLIGGLLFTGLFGLFLLVISVRQTDTMEWLIEDRRFFLPSIIFISAALTSYYFYDTLKKKEIEYIQRVVQEEMKNIEQMISRQSVDSLNDIKRIAQRKVSEENTKKNIWLEDAKNHVEQIDGLRVLEWVNSYNQVQWIYPEAGSENAIGSNVVINDEIKYDFEYAVRNNNITVTQPIDLAQVYKAFIVYAPVIINDNFKGFVSAVFDVEDFLNLILVDDTSDDFLVSISNADKIFYTNIPGKKPESEKAFTLKKQFRFHNKDWNLEIVPTADFVENQFSNLPNIIFIAGLMISLLLAVTVRYILLARMKSNYLLRSNKLNEAILSNAEYMIIATDRNGKVILFNDAAEQLLGYSASEVIGIHTFELWHDHDEIVERAKEMSHELGLPVDYGFEVFTIKSEMGYIDTHEWTIIRKDGLCFPASLTVSPLRDGNGHTTGYLGIAEDISERKRQQKALEASEETFRTAMEYASIGMALVGLDGMFILVNNALCKIVGYPKEELITLNFQYITHPDDLERDLNNISKMLAGEIPNYNLEKRYIRKDGSPVWVSISVSVARDDTGKPKHFISQMQDITERKEVERIKSEFISVVSHELRTPLTSIRGSLGLIEGTMEKDIPEKALNLIKIAYKNSERLILLINDILDLDKIAAGKMRFDLQSQSVAEMVKIGVESNKAYAEKFNVSVECASLSELIKIKVDPNRWQQVFSNLLSNAIKFSPEGGTVGIYYVRENGRIRLCVKDNGNGIPEEFKNRIFSKFSQADSTNSRNKGGTGLGLNISREIVARMNGEIGFESEAGKGSVFWFEFPEISEVKSVIIQEAETSEIQVELPYILHIEDDEDFGNVISESLSGKAVVKTAATLSAAREMFKDYQFAAVVLDIELPDGSGLSFLDYIEENISPLLPKIIILAAEDAPANIRDKVSACLVKSRISEKKIIETILSYIHNKSGE